MNWLSRRLSPKNLRPLLASRGAWKVVVGKSEEGKQEVSSHIGWCTSLSFPTNAFLDERTKVPFILRLVQHRNIVAREMGKMKSRTNVLPLSDRYQKLWNPSKITKVGTCRGIHVQITTEKPPPFGQYVVTTILLTALILSCVLGVYTMATIPY